MRFIELHYAETDWKGSNELPLSGSPVTVRIDAIDAVTPGDGRTCHSFVYLHGQARDARLEVYESYDELRARLMASGGAII